MKRTDLTRLQSLLNEVRQDYAERVLKRLGEIRSQPGPIKRLDPTDMKKPVAVMSRSFENWSVRFGIHDREIFLSYYGIDPYSLSKRVPFRFNTDGESTKMSPEQVAVAFGKALSHYTIPKYVHK